MKYILTLLIFLKNFGFIYRIIGVVITFALLSEAVPDLKFNSDIKHIKNFTLDQVKKTNKEKLPRYFGISDVSAYGDLYVENFSIKNGDTTLSSIVYPVYQNDINVQNLKDIECDVIVADDRVKFEDLDEYFNKNAHIKGKFDGEFISDESKKILTDNGYKIAKNCIMLTKGKEPLEVGFCLLIIFGAALALILVGLSFIPTSRLERIFENKTIII